MEGRCEDGEAGRGGRVCSCVPHLPPSYRGRDLSLARDCQLEHRLHLEHTMPRGDLLGAQLQQKSARRRE